MKKFGNNIIQYFIIGTLVATGLIGICCYFLYGTEIAIISIFGALLGFTIIHMILFYFWVTSKTE